MNTHMNAHRTAPAGAIIYQVSIKDVVDSVTTDYRTAMERLGFKIAGTLKAMEGWKLLSEFPSLNTDELAGTYLHRIRYAMKVSNYRNEDLKIIEHGITDNAAESSFIRTIYPSNEFDPAFEVQMTLYRVADDILTIEQASQHVHQTIVNDIQRFRTIVTDDEIVNHMRDIHARMGGHNFLNTEISDSSAFLDQLPDATVARFDTLAKLAFTDRKTPDSTVKPA